MSYCAAHKTDDSCFLIEEWIPVSCSKEIADKRKLKYEQDKFPPTGLFLGYERYIKQDGNGQHIYETKKPVKGKLWTEWPVRRGMHL